MKSTFFILLTLLSLLLPNKMIRAEDEFGDHEDHNPYNDEAYYPGEAYCCSRQCCGMAIAVGVGILVFTGMIIVIIRDGKTAHHSH